jgi:transposase
LTPAERRTAELAAAGHMNREIAKTLVVTLATVEYHLRNAYRKLGIASRKKLKEVLPLAPRIDARMHGSSIAAVEIGLGYRWERRSSAASSTSWARAR